jgi:sister-chromatid-cohesion protein PDS5
LPIRTVLNSDQGPYFSDYYYLLDSICTTRSVALIADLNADILIIDLFKNIFEIVTLETSPAVKKYLLEIMQQLIDECNYLPMPAVVHLLSQFEKKSQKASPAAFDFACRKF